MRKASRITAVVAGAGIVVLVGVAAAQRPGAVQLNADSLSQQLGLTPQAKAQIAPQIDELNALLGRLQKARQDHQDLWTQLQAAQQKIARDLSPEQQQAFGRALAQAWGYGPGMGMAGGSMMGYGNHMGYAGHMGYGAHMGQGFMGGRGMGQGGAMMGGGFGMHGSGWRGMHSGWMGGWGATARDTTGGN